MASASLASPSARASDYDDALRAGVVARDRARSSQFVSDWQAALEHFERAVALEPSAAARFELAEAAAALGRVALAYESYELALTSGLSGKAESVARGYLEAHAGEVARVEIVAPAGTVVLVDGRERARLPLARPLVVAAGRVTLALAPPDAAAWQETWEIEPRALRRIELGRAALGPDVMPARAGGAGSPPRAGGARLPPERLRVEPESPSWLGRHPAAVAVLSVAGASLVAGAWLAYKAKTTDDDAQDARSQIRVALAGHVAGGLVGADAVPCGNGGIAAGVVSFGDQVDGSTRQALVGQYADACELFAERRDRADRFATLSYVGLGVGLAATAAVLTWYIAAPADHPLPGADRPRARVAPLLSGDVRGALVELTF